MTGGNSDVVDAALECRRAREYDEAVFLYFLGVESSRADRSNNPLLLLLVTVEPVLDTPVRISRATAAQLFSSLNEAVRETDVTGWYRQDLVAGALLAAGCADSSGSKPGYPIRQRVGEELRKRLPPSTARNLRLRLVELPRMVAGK